MKNLWRDFGYGLRLLRKNPGFTLVAVLALALGIGANTAIYSIFYATLIADFPYPHSEQLVVVWSRAARTNRDVVSTGDYFDWKRESTVFQSLGVVRGGSFNLSIGEKPERIQGDYLSPGFLDQIIGDRPFMGRYFLPEEGVAGKDHVVIITHKPWQGYFASDPNIPASMWPTFCWQFEHHHSELRTFAANRAWWARTNSVRWSTPPKTMSIGRSGTSIWPIFLPAGS
jgi:putative ABC transport system permease protein